MRLGEQVKLAAAWEALSPEMQQIEKENEPYKTFLQMRKNTRSLSINLPLQAAVPIISGSISC